MKVVKRSLLEKLKCFDPFLMLCTVGLSLVSVAVLWGGRGDFGSRAFLMQLAMSVAGIVAAIVLASFDYEHIVNKYYIVAFLGSVLILAVTALFGVSIGSNRSWLEIPIVGIAVQPSEFVKAAYIMTFAKHLSMVKETINKPKTLALLALHAGIIIGCVLISGDLGVALMYIGITAVMLFSAGLSGWYFVAVIAVVALAFPYIWDMLELYQQERILLAFNPELDPTGKGQQAIIGRKAIMNGGLTGCGIKGGYYYTTLPVAESDFMYATLCEKLGFLGGFGVLALMMLAVARILIIGRQARYDFGTYMCAGVAGMLVLQTVVNVGMCLVMFPVIGITLPFVSAGGSSVLATYIILGMVHSVRAGRSKFRLG